MQPWTADQFSSSIKSEMDHGTKYFSTRQGNQALANVESVARELKESGRMIVEPHVPKEQLDKVIGGMETGSGR